MLYPTLDYLESYINRVTTARDGYRVSHLVPVRSRVMTLPAQPCRRPDSLRQVSSPCIALRRLMEDKEHQNEVPFLKLHGNGNDFIVVDETRKEVVPESYKGEFAAFACHRRAGIGADGVLFMSKSHKADLRFRLFQPDRSEAEMSGNGMRCFVKYAFDMGYAKDKCRVETSAGVVEVASGYQNGVFKACVSMPPPKFLRKEIPATGDPAQKFKEKIGEFEVVAVRVGVPHAILRVENVNKIDLMKTGRMIRTSSFFPEGCNVDFVQFISKTHLKIRTYERGVEEETLSCGTGATSSAVMMHDLGLVDSPVLVDTPGGPLTITISDGVVKMEAPAVTVFRGFLPFNPKQQTPKPQTHVLSDKHT